VRIVANISTYGAADRNVPFLSTSNDVVLSEALQMLACKKEKLKRSESLFARHAVKLKSNVQTDKKI
jgi:hypothetical protein